MSPSAEKIAALEREVPDDAEESSKRVRELIEETYTLPAEAVTSQSLSSADLKLPAAGAASTVTAVLVVWEERCISG